MQLNHLSDVELVSTFQQKQQEAAIFNTIVLRYKEKLYWHLRRMVVIHDDADDLLQETFIKAWRFLPNFRQDSTLYTWLYRIATNNALTFIAQAKKQRNVGDASELLDKVATNQGFDAQKIEWKLQLAIQTLPEKQKAVFSLRYYDEMPYEQMSEVLETSVGALKASYHHAAKKIETYILNH